MWAWGWLGGGASGREWRWSPWAAVMGSTWGGLEAETVTALRPLGRYRVVVPRRDRGRRRKAWGRNSS